MRLAEDTGVPSDVIETSFWHLNDEICRGTITMDEFNERFAKRLKIETVDWAKYYLETIEVITEMQELLKWASEHYRIGLLTNIMPGMLRTMLQQGILPNLEYDCVIDSSEVGAIKPEARIYEIAQAQADCAPEEILLIDDSRANLMAAEKVGWHVLWFDYARPNESVINVREALAPSE
jgi:FMN phosphatase YigB (HAD superfamily)